MTDLHEIYRASLASPTLLERLSTVQRQFSELTDKASRFLTWCACGQTHALSEDCPRCDITTSWQAPR